MIRNQIVALFALIPAPAASAAVFIHDESLHGDLSDDYLVPTSFTPSAGSSTLKGTVADVRSGGFGKTGCGMQGGG